MLNWFEMKSAPILLKLDLIKIGSALIKIINNNNIPILKKLKIENSHIVVRMRDRPSNTPSVRKKIDGKNKIRIINSSFEAAQQFLKLREPLPNFYFRSARMLPVA